MQAGCDEKSGRHTRTPKTQERKIYSSRTVRYAPVRTFTRTDAVTVSRENALPVRARAPVCVCVCVRVRVCVSGGNESTSVETVFRYSFSTRKFNQLHGTPTSFRGIYLEQLCNLGKPSVASSIAFAISCTSARAARARPQRSRYYTHSRSWICCGPDNTVYGELTRFPWLRAVKARSRNRYRYMYVRMYVCIYVCMCIYYVYPLERYWEKISQQDLPVKYVPTDRGREHFRSRIE